MVTIFTTEFFYSIFRIATPILLATLAAVIGEKGGVSNIGLDGIMTILIISVRADNEVYEEAYRRRIIYGL